MAGPARRLAIRQPLPGQPSLTSPLSHMPSTRLKPRVVPHCAFAVLAALASVLLQGCVYPSRTVHSATYAGRVMDVETKLPISGARVQVDAGSLRSASTSMTDGGFEVGPITCWRLALFIPSPEGRWPLECKHMMPPNMYFSLNTSHRGYEAAQLLVPKSGTNFLNIYLRRKP